MIDYRRKFENDMKVNIHELKNGFNEVFKALIDRGVEEVDLYVDFYWNIDESERYNMDIKPNSLDIGQLSDDYLELQKINLGQSEPMPYSLVWLSSLARAVGENRIV